MGYALGRKSRRELKGVHPDLGRVVRRAIEITKQDFTVHDGIRTMKEQREYVRRKVSKTLRSKHLPQKDGYGHAVDLVPYINGKLRWEWGPIYEIAEAMRTAAKEKGVRVRWGGIWARFDNTRLSPKKLVAKYVASRMKLGKEAFIDGPHFRIIL